MAEAIAMAQAAPTKYGAILMDMQMPERSGLAATRALPPHAREIQTGLLPANVTAQIQGTGLDVHAVLEPARQVGGDLFEVLRLGPDRVLVAVGDVSGKGTLSALFMAVALRPHDVTCGTAASIIPEDLRYSGPS
jgi:serine phosphatase RsbU (regulator of sigma subunit)